MFVGGLDALRATTYFTTTQHKYAQHNYFQEDMPKRKYKLTYKGVIRFGLGLVFFFFLKEKKCSLSI